MDHCEPFLRSASASSVSLRSENPTAVHAVLDLHDTSPRKLLLAPAGCGTRWNDHFDMAVAPAVGHDASVTDHTAAQMVAPHRDPNPQRTT